MISGERLKRVAQGGYLVLLVIAGAWLATYKPVPDYQNWRVLLTAALGLLLPVIAWYDQKQPYVIAWFTFLHAVIATPFFYMMVTGFGRNLNQAALVFASIGPALVILLMFGLFTLLAEGFTAKR